MTVGDPDSVQAEDAEATVPVGGAPARPRLRFWQELPILVLIAVGLAVLIKTFLFQAFFIPSPSMEKTLHGCDGCRGDRVMVNKVVYHLRDIKRGDIVVFDGKDNYDDGTGTVEPGNIVSRGLHDVADLVGLTPKATDYIKRVIGLPGDTVACCDSEGRLTVNGVGLDEPYVFVDPGAVEEKKTFGPVVVPAGKLWVMGDHRNASEDSRFVGAVPEKDVIGRAFVIIWPPSRWTFLSPRSYAGLSVHLTSAVPLAAGAALACAGSAVRQRRHRSPGPARDTKKGSGPSQAG